MGTIEGYFFGNTFFVFLFGLFWATFCGTVGELLWGYFLGILFVCIFCGVFLSFFGLFLWYWLSVFLGVTYCYIVVFIVFFTHNILVWTVDTTGFLIA